MTNKSGIKIGIVIPIFQIKYIKKLMHNILNQKYKNNFQICIVNDGKKEYSDILNAMKYPGNVVIVTTTGTVGFSKANNYGWEYLLSEYKEIEYLGSINDDTIPRDGWLDALVDSIKALPRTALAVPITEEKNGFLKKIDLCQYAFDNHLAIKCVGFKIEEDFFVPAATGVCFLADAKILKEVDFLDEGYKNSCEDVDLCLKMITNGYRIVLSKNSRVFHFGGKSRGLKEADTNYGISHARLDEKWGTNIIKYNRLNKEGFLIKNGDLEKENKSPYLTCMECSNVLLVNETIAFCGKCNKTYEIKDKIIIMTKNDKFYEGSYDATINFVAKNISRLKFLIYLYFVNSHYLYYIRKYINKRGVILDVGCGGGIKYLGEKGNVIGVDLSYRSLLKTTEFYSHSIQCDVLKMPFIGGSFDYVSSCFVFEHLTTGEKNELLEKTHKIMKNDGIVMMLFDCDSNNALFKWLKKYPDLYNESIVGINNHIGLLKASENIELFKKNGFKIIKCKGYNKTVIQYLPVYIWMKSYAKVSFFVSLLYNFANYISKFNIVVHIYQALVTIFDDIVDVFFPLDNSRLLIVIAKKEEKIYENI